MQSPGQSDHYYYGLWTTASVIRRARVVIIFANGSRAVQNVNRRWAAKSRRACVLLFLCSQNFAGFSRFSPFFWRSCWRFSAAEREIEANRLRFTHKDNKTNKKQATESLKLQQEGEEKEFVCYKKTLRFLRLVLIVYFAAGGRLVMSKQAISDPESLEIATHSSRQASPCSEQKLKNPWRSLSKTSLMCIIICLDNQILRSTCDNLLRSALPCTVCFRSDKQGLLSDITADLVWYQAPSILSSYLLLQADH